MNILRDSDAVIAAWLDDGPSALPGDTRRAIAVGIRTNPRHQPGFGLPFGRLRMPTMDLRRLFVAFASATAVLIVAAVALSLLVNQSGIGGPSPTPSPAASWTARPSLTATEAPASTPTFVAGRIWCGDQIGIRRAGTLGCSSDGTRLLVQKGDGNLFVVHADGSETQLTEQMLGIHEKGSSRPTGATISPDGSRVVFADLTETGLSCHNGALFAVDADGGPAELLWQSQAADEGGIVKYPTFSPDGTQIAFVDGYCDHNHSVWVMNPDGSNAHQIVSSEILGAIWVYGLAWSAAGDRIGIQFSRVTFEGGPIGPAFYTFATDGSDLTKGGDGSKFCLPGWQC